MHSPSSIQPIQGAPWLAWASALFLAAALFYAPLAYGCTRPEFLPPLYGLLLASIVMFALNLAFRKRGPAPFAIPLACVSLIVLQGWWVTWDPVFHSLQFATAGLADTSFDSIRQHSFDSMVGTTLLLGGFLVACELFRDERLRRFLLLSAAASGILICVVGIILKFGGESLMLLVWKKSEMTWNNFALYHYHGNAGAFLNLVWPLILVFTRRAYSPTVSALHKIVWTLASLACGAALFLNASKVALVIGLLILPWPFLTWLKAMPKKTLVGLAVCIAFFVLAGLVASSRLTEESAFARIKEGGDFATSADGRVNAYKSYVNALPDVGLFGVGPGLFQVAFPYQNSPLRDVRPDLYPYAHQDYLQTMIEWGWAGFIWWLVLIVGGICQAYRSYRHRALFSSRTDRHLVLAAMLGVIGTLTHAMVDFPLQVASIRLFFYLLLALCWASPSLLETSTYGTSHRRSSSRKTKPA